jgi:aminoglycoside phosphotransferase (APT) family kinase protein
MGAAAAALTRSRLALPTSYDATTQLADSTRKVAELIRLVPGLGPAATRLLDELRALQAAARGPAPRPIHGAPHAHQWLICGDRLGLVDFDRVALGDPERDAATFMAELDFEDRTTVGVEELNRAFLGGYEEVAGALDPALLRAYRAHKRLAKALRTARALRPDGDERAERHLARAAECVATGAAV